MKNLYFLGAFVLLLTGACTTRVAQTTYISAPQNNSMITLQEPKTREIAHCYSSGKTTAEECAKMMESTGFVRISDIPTQAAKYDVKKAETYPTRRWREGEKNPRW